MMEMIQANWLALVLALIIGLLVAWWLFGRASTVARPRERRPDVLDEGAAPAQRNQALIDAPPAAASAITPSAASGTMAGVAEVVAVAAQDTVEAATPAPAVTGTEADDLSQLKGVGPKLVALLHGMGITRFAQIAAWTEEDIARIDAQLGSFKGRITRDNWVEQAKFLASGDKAGFEAQFGKL